MKKPLLIFYPILILFFISVCHVLLAQDFSSITRLNDFSTSRNTGEKNQSKIWFHGGYHWAVMPDSKGTHIWRLNSTSWERVLTISSRTDTKADCKVVDNVVHIFLFRKSSSSELISVEYEQSANTYKRWATRTSTTHVTLDSGVETATIDIDGKGRMWLASDGVNEIFVRASDYPYTSWSSRIQIASGITDDDICSVVVLPGKVGVFWSNQNTKRFGFKTHVDGAALTDWSGDEIPGSRYAVNVGAGMADDHINLATVSNGTLYCAIKTGYDTRGYPRVALMVRHPDGVWDEPYKVSEAGTRPIVLINESGGSIKIVYCSKEKGGDILYSSSLLTKISFGSPKVLLSGSYINPTSIKSGYSSEVVILASTESEAYAAGVMARDNNPIPPKPEVPAIPVLASPTNASINVVTSPTLTWNTAAGSTTYQAQLSTDAGFSAIVLDRPGLQATNTNISNLSAGTVYYWRVRASNQAGSSGWSETWSFTTEQVTAPPSAPQIPILASPANSATGVSTSPALSWGTSAGADTYQAQLSTASDFSSAVLDQSGIQTTSTSATGLSANTAYYWRVRATNSAGSSSWSEVWSFTTEQESTPPPSGSLVGHWPMNEGIGTILNDESGHDNHAQAIKNPGWAEGTSGTCIDLDGSKQYASVPDAASLDIVDAITVMGWVKPERYATQYIVCKAVTGEIDGYEFSLATGGEVFFRLNHASSGNDYRLSSSVNYPTNGTTWVHLAATYDGTRMQLYINGELNASLTPNVPPKIGTNDLPLNIGARSDGKNKLLGAIDDVRIYNTALSAAEINAIASNRVSTASIAQQLSTTSETADEELLDLHVYPNPMNTEATLNFRMRDAGDYTVTLYSSNGSKMAEIAKGSSQPQSDNMVKLDVKKLPKGLYLLKLQTKNTSKTLKVLLER